MNLKKIVKNKISDSYKTILDVEGLCNTVGETLDTQFEAQDKIAGILNYLQDWHVIDSWNEDKLDWVFSDDMSY